ncbi:ROK family protein [Planctomicrobium sp. SH661]|uniref:ROK family protein n=1 Tax=Planctomicrobium sp. SH661 TaxID=3448124 RepID=UPI003F5B968F
MVRHLRNTHGVSRVELARRMDLSPSTVGRYVDRLIESGFLQEGSKLAQAAGRPPTVLGLNPAAGCFVGIDIERRQFWITAVDFAQQPLNSKRIRIQPTESAEDVFAKAERVIASIVGSHGPLQGIAMGVPGVFDMKTGTTLHYEHIRGWQKLPLKQRFEKRFGVPVSLENNIRVMALAEELFGQGRDVNDFICLGIRSGIAAGIVIDRRLHTGPDHLAGEIGNWPCDQGLPLEQLASLSAILKILEEAIQAGERTSLSLRDGSLRVQDVLAAAREADPLVLDVLWNAGKVVGGVLAQMSFVLNPERIIISGPLAELKSQFIRSIQETMETMVRPPHGSMPNVVGSTLGEYAGALGGAALAVGQWSPLLINN